MKTKVGSVSESKSNTGHKVGHGFYVRLPWGVFSDPDQLKFLTR